MRAFKLPRFSLFLLDLVSFSFLSDSPSRIEKGKRDDATLFEADSSPFVPSLVLCFFAALEDSATSTRTTIPALDLSVPSRSPRRLTATTTC